jgi:hypothetical protein
MTLPHIYIMNLKKDLKKLNKKMDRLVSKIYVLFDAKTLIPEDIELHYNDPELEDQYSLRGSKVLHRMYKFPKTPLKFQKPLDNEGAKLVLVYDNWKSVWSVHATPEADLE